MTRQLTRFFFILLSLAMLGLYAPTALSKAQNCGKLESDIRFAGLDWPSARFHSATARYILEHGFDCSTDSVSGSTIPLIKGLTQDEIDISMEVWKGNAPNIYLEALENKDVLELGLITEGVEAFFVPRYLIEGDSERGIEALAPNLKSVSDLLAYADIFQDPQEPSKGRFYNCVEGWRCQQINTVKFYAYHLDEAFTNYSSESLKDLEDAIEGAYRNGEAIVAYYWGPTWILGHFDMVMLEEPAFDETVWATMQAASDNEAFDTVSSAVAYPRNIVTIAVGKTMAEQAPAEVIDFLTSYQMDQLTVSKYLAVIQTEVLEPEAAAISFLRDMPELWTTWLSEEVAEKIQFALLKE